MPAFAFRHWLVCAERTFRFLMHDAAPVEVPPRDWERQSGVDLTVSVLTGHESLSGSVKCVSGNVATSSSS